MTDPLERRLAELLTDARLAISAPPDAAGRILAGTRRARRRTVTARAVTAVVATTAAGGALVTIPDGSAVGGRQLPPATGSGTPPCELISASVTPSAWVFASRSPTAAPESVPGSVTASVPQSVTRSVLESLTASVTASVPESVGASASVSESVEASATESATEAAPESIDAADTVLSGIVTPGGPVPSQLATAVPRVAGSAEPTRLPGPMRRGPGGPLLCEVGADGKLHLIAEDGTLWPTERPLPPELHAPVEERTPVP